MHRHTDTHTNSLFSCPFLCLSLSLSLSLLRARSLSCCACNTQTYMNTYIHTHIVHICIYVHTKHTLHTCCSVLQFVAVCCSVLQCVVECCRVLQCVAVCPNIHYIHAQRTNTLLSNWGCSPTSMRSDVRGVCLCVVIPTVIPNGHS